MKVCPNLFFMTFPLVLDHLPSILKEPAESEKVDFFEIPYPWARGINLDQNSLVPYPSTLWHNETRILAGKMRTKILFKFIQSKT